MVFDALLRFRVRADRPTPASHTDSNTGTSPKQSHSESRGQGNSRILLLSITDLPVWRDPNPFILTGYRPESRSSFSCFASCLYWHNESCNIYSHLIPGVVLLLAQGVLYDFIRGKHWDLDTFDWSILALQQLTASFCFLVSAAYHTLLNHSQSVAHRWLQFDYVGILALILGNFISGLHFGFYCTPELKYFYWFLIIALGTTTGFTLLIPKFRGPEWRSFRLGSLIATGLSAFAPIGHASMRWGLSYTASIGVPYYLLEGILLVIGCYFWERRIPERLSPGRFDFWGSSHTIWHVFVALSVVAHIGGLVSALDYVYAYEWCRLS